MKTYPPLIRDALRYLDSMGAELTTRDKRPWSRRLLWSLGVPLPPPPLTGFCVNAAVSGTGFGLYFGGFMTLANLVLGPERSPSLLAGSIFFGTFMGLHVAIRAWLVASKSSLPSWRHFRTNLKNFVPQDTAPPERL